MATPSSTRLDTPFVKLSDNDAENVYSPSEDTFLLIDILEEDFDTLTREIKPYACLEIGSGSGIVITALAMALNKFHKAYYMAVDINSHACSVTRKTGMNNHVDLDIVQMDLLSCLTSKSIFDIILFNPPYVVTESDEISDETLISKAWAGGENGREVMEKIFPIIPDLLSDVGIFYLVVIKENDPQYIIDCFKKLGMFGTIAITRKVRGEVLSVLRFEKKQRFGQVLPNRTIIAN